MQPKYCKFRDDIEESVRFKNYLQGQIVEREVMFFLQKHKSIMHLLR